MSSFAVCGHATSWPALWIPVVIALLSLSGCGDESLPAPTRADTPAQSATTTTTTAAPVTDAPTTSALANTTTSTTTTAQPEPVDQIVPSGLIPRLDGVLEPDEWSNATAVPMSDGASLYLQHTDEVLYVAVEAADIGAVNIIIATDTDVWILHSSAALGSAHYVRSSSAWVMDHGFEWCCRRGSDDSARAALFAAEGWDANIGFDGDAGVVEYAITLPWVDANVAVSSIRSDDDKGFFPTDLSDEQREELLGVPPAERTFSINDWARLRTDQ